MAGCLSPEELRRYASGSMAAGELLEADAHLVSCASCRAQFLETSVPTRAVSSLAEKASWDAGAEFNCLDDAQAAAYVEGTLDAADRESVESHLDLCPQCAGDVRSLQEFRAAMSTYPRTVFAPEPHRSPRTGWAAAWHSFFAPPRAYAWVPAAASLAAVALCTYQLSRNAGLSAQLSPLRGEIVSLRAEMQATSQRAEMQRQRAERMEGQLQAAQQALRDREQRLTEAQHQLQRKGAAPAATLGSAASPPPAAPAERSLIALKDGGGTIEVKLVLPPGVSLPPDLARVTEEMLRTGETRPTEPVRLALAQLSSEGEAVRGAGEELPVPLSPVRTFVLSTRPAFRWKPVAGASGYVVSLYSDQPRRQLWKKEVPGPGSLVFPTGEPALRPGATYLWRVEAQMGTEPSGAIVARFCVLPEPRRQEVLRLSRRYAGFHTVLAALYQREGLADDAEQALQQLLRRNPGSETAQRLLQLLQGQRRSAAVEMP